jgi:predicted phage-related endonuclease
VSTAPAPGTPEWARKVSASKVAAILGLSPWESPRSMWHKMRGEPPNDDGSNAEAKARGQYLEAGIVAWFKDQHPGLGETREQVHQRFEDWGAATPDLVGDDDGFGNEFVMDAKSANTDDDWGDEPPAYYLAQSYWQLACAPSANVAYIAVLFGRPRLGFREYVIQRDDDLIASIVARCREFYDSLTSDVPPPLDDHPATYEAIRKLHPDIDRDEVADLSADEAREYVEAEAAFKAAEVRAKAARSVVLDRMGRARLAKHDGLTVARRQPNKYGVSLVAVAKTIDTEGESAA